MSIDFRGTDITATRNAQIAGRIRQGLETFDSGTSTTVTLVPTSKYTVHLTGSAAMAITLPAANGTGALVVGQGAEFRIINNNASDATIARNGGIALGTIKAGESVEVICTVDTTAAGVWELIQLERDEDSYAQFNITLNTNVAPTVDASWTLANGFYTVTITKATHGRGDTPDVRVRNAANGVVITDVDVNSSNGLVTITVSETPDGREAFQVTIV